MLPRGHDPRVQVIPLRLRPPGEPGSPPGADPATALEAYVRMIEHMLAAMHALAEGQVLLLAKLERLEARMREREAPTP